MLVRGYLETRIRKSQAFKSLLMKQTASLNTVTSKSWTRTKCEILVPIITPYQYFHYFLGLKDE